MKQQNEKKSLHQLPLQKTVENITYALEQGDAMEAQFYAQRLVFYLQEVTTFKTIKYQGGGEYEGRN